MQVALSTDSVRRPNRSSIAINTKVAVRLKNSKESAIITCESLVSLQALISWKSILSTHLGLVLLIHLLRHHLGCGCGHSHLRLGKVLTWITNNHCSSGWNKFLFNVNYCSVGLNGCDILCEIRVVCSHLNCSSRLNLSPSASWITHAAKNDGNNNYKEHNSNCCDDSSWSTALSGHLLQTSIILSQASWIILIAIVSIPVVVGVHSVSEVHVVSVSVSVGWARFINRHSSGHGARSVDCSNWFISSWICSRVGRAVSSSIAWAVITWAVSCCVCAGAISCRVCAGAVSSWVCAGAVSSWVCAWTVRARRVRWWVAWSSFSWRVG